MIENQEAVVLQSNQGEMNKCLIEANPIIYKILSDGLYENKIAAIIRELSCNACDAMTENGTLETKNFKVHLPTILEPYFSIRDFGPGLDEEGIARVFTFGMSTRRESNDFNGAFGIGAKSPYAYTKSGFTINSFIDGKCWVYTSLLVDGGPAYIFNEVCDEPDEENGLEIILQVENKDIDRFQEEALYIYYWFDKRPDINITLNYDSYIKLKSEGNSYVKTDYDYYRIKGNNGILIGQVLYNIPRSVLNSFSYQERDLLSKIILKFKIGDLTIMPSRESVDDTDTNREKILSKLNDFLNEVESVVSKNLEKVDNPDSYEGYLEIKNIIKLNEDFLNYQSLEKIYKNYPIYKNLNEILRSPNKISCISSGSYKRISNTRGFSGSMLRFNEKSIIYNRQVSNKILLIDSDIKKYDKYNIIKINLSKFEKNKSNRYDYDDIKKKIIAILRDSFKLDQNHIEKFIFTSDIYNKYLDKFQPTKKAKNVKHSTKKICECESYDLDSLSSFSNLTLNFKDLKESYLYIRIDAKYSNKLITSDGKLLPNARNKVEYISKMLNDINRLQPDLNLIPSSKKLLLIYKTKISDIYLKNEKLIDATKILKEHSKKIIKRDFSELNNFLKSFYDSDKLKYLKNDIEYKSTFLKYLIEKSNIIEEIKNKENETDLYYGSLDESFPVTMIKRPFNIDWIKDYKEIYGKDFLDKLFHKYYSYDMMNMDDDIHRDEIYYLNYTKIKNESEKKYEDLYKLKYKEMLKKILSREEELNIKETELKIIEAGLKMKEKDINDKIYKHMIEFKPKEKNEISIGKEE